MAKIVWNQGNTKRISIAFAADESPVEVALTEFYAGKSPLLADADGKIQAALRAILTKEGVTLRTLYQTYLTNPQDAVNALAFAVMLRAEQVTAAQAEKKNTLPALADSSALTSFVQRGMEQQARAGLEGSAAATSTVNTQSELLYTLPLIEKFPAMIDAGQGITIAQGIQGFDQPAHQTPKFQQACADAYMKGLAALTGKSIAQIQAMNATQMRMLVEGIPTLPFANKQKAYAALYIDYLNAREKGSYHGYEHMVAISLLDRLEEMAPAVIATPSHATEYAIPRSRRSFGYKSIARGFAENAAYAEAPGMFTQAPKHVPEIFSTTPDIRPGMTYHVDTLTHTENQTTSLAEIAQKSPALLRLIQELYPQINGQSLGAQAVLGIAVNLLNEHNREQLQKTTLDQTPVPVKGMNIRIPTREEVQAGAAQYRANLEKPAQETQEQEEVAATATSATTAPAANQLANEIAAAATKIEQKVALTQEQIQAKIDAEAAEIRAKQEKPRQEEQRRQQEQRAQEQKRQELANRMVQATDETTLKRLVRERRHERHTNANDQQKMHDYLEKVRIALGRDKIDATVERAGQVLATVNQSVLVAEMQGLHRRSPLAEGTVLLLPTDAQITTGIAHLKTTIARKDSDAVFLSRHGETITPGEANRAIVGDNRLRQVMAASL